MSSKRNSTTALSIADRLQAPSEGKFIAYDHLADGDYACFLDRQFLGYASSYSEAEVKIVAIYNDQLTDTITDSADIEADAALPFEPTQAELNAYAAEWDKAVAEAQAALVVYVEEWDAAVVKMKDYTPTEVYGNPELDAIIRHLLDETITH